MARSRLAHEGRRRAMSITGLSDDFFRVMRRRSCLYRPGGKRFGRYETSQDFWGAGYSDAVGQEKAQNATFPSEEEGCVRAAVVCSRDSGVELGVSATLNGPPEALYHHRGRHWSMMEPHHHTPIIWSLNILD